METPGSPEDPLKAIKDREGVRAYMFNWGLDEEFTDGWLEHPSRYLHNKTPDEMLAAGEVGAVVEAMEAYLDAVPVAEFFAAKAAREAMGQVLPFRRPDRS